MSDGTPIEWTDATVNAVNGCSVVSPGCTNCYAMRAGGRNLPTHPSTGLTQPSKAGHVWTGEVRLNERALLDPLRWRLPRRIFWNAHGDLFHENVPDEWIDRCFAVMACTPQHTHQVLTKRSVRMRAYMKAMWDRPDAFGSATAAVVRAAGLDFEAGIAAIDAVEFPFPNVWLGVSVEDQTRADERVPDLLATPAAVRFLSCEPLLGRVNLLDLIYHACPNWLDDDGYPPSIDRSTGARECCSTCDWSGVGDLGIDWVIVGGESGRGARPMHPDWARSLRDQCAAAGVPFHFKQWGNWLPCHHRRHEDGVRWAPVARDGTDRVFEFGAHAGQSTCIMADPGYRSIDDPMFWWFDKSTAGRLLDGVQHDGMPA